MLDTFRKRDNLRPASPGQPGTRPVGPNLVHAPGAPVVAVPQRPEPAAAKPAAPEPTPALAAAQAAAPVSAPLQNDAKAEVEPSAARLTVGPDIKLKGAEITDCDTLVVEGQVDASMDSRVVEIAESGIFRGKVNVEVAEIRGRFEGDLTARKHLVVRETGRVSGTIRYGRIRIDEGGVVCGDVAATDAGAAR